MVQCHHRPTYDVKDLSPDVNQLILKAENDGMDVPHEIKLKALHFILNYNHVN